MFKCKADFINEDEPETKLSKTFHLPVKPEAKMSVKINPPDLKCAKNYECFENELLLW